ncbi:F-box protein At4g00755 [Vigna radiata var. radiata]|uniref:F-box protein At4g00755 n=1 Tax=Vigna radiata var. radiata TaxID=3916 RepID=A0A1S3TX10_VIGRR|nr:F-box protein At4g00755 [Vigna radiata var. radiata]XP_014498305.1 F-box protein At4g00755 [Vigna radiata var. radiata]XP_014498306.1 F-box protein At4g00755 [Vigna radiata var. radiata]XP_022635596.1 F-box protein At4g00755 [Vigna radiata var. radiata]
MECHEDFISYLDSDTSLKILECLDDPADLVRVTCVSRSLRQSVIANGLCKQLCLRMFPQLSRVAFVVELNQHGGKEHAEVGSSNSTEWLVLQREHRVFSYLSKALMSSVAMNCIAKTIGASSTDNFPQESIDNTLEPRDVIGGRYSYWSSNGQSNPNVPETLTYELVSQICLITEINIRPFQAYFQLGSPIYSASSVRFKMGHPKASLDAVDDELFVWTYTSPEFPMSQENKLQTFKLPEPVLCIGGILQIELLGRVQRQEMDGLLYICVSHVQVLGGSLSPPFNVEILQPSGIFVLKRDQLASEEPKIVRDIRRLVTILQARGVGVLEWDQDDDDDIYDSDPEYAL